MLTIDILAPRAIVPELDFVEQAEAWIVRRLFDKATRRLRRNQKTVLMKATFADQDTSVMVMS